MLATAAPIFLRDHELIQITEDHSLVNELVKSGQITAEMALNHPRKNVLTRSVGMPNTVEVDVAIHYFAEVITCFFAQTD